jgi:hypothetical protein
VFLGELVGERGSSTLKMARHHPEKCVVFHSTLCARHLAP